jgi:hypothetical protein
MIDFKRELIGEGIDGWVVRSSYIDDEGITRSLQVRWNRKPKGRLLESDYQFLEKKLLLGENLRVLRKNGLKVVGVV